MQSAIQETEARMRTEYHNRVVELEKERAAIVEDKAQVDSYKELLLKQRDVMISLTSSLNKRDETILALQEEVDAFDHHQREMEDILDQKTSEILHLQKYLLEQGVQIAQEDFHDLDSQQEGLKMGLPTANDNSDESNDNKARQSISHVQQQNKVACEQMRGKLIKMREEKTSLEYLLRERLEQMVQTEIEERIAKICQEQPALCADHTANSNLGFIELASLRSDTPEFQQRLASIVQIESRRKHSTGMSESNEELLRRQRTLKDALSQKGNLMMQVCNEVKDTQSHQRLLRKMMAQDGDGRKALLQLDNQGSERVADKSKLDHQTKMNQFRKEIAAKENEIQMLLGAKRKTLGGSAVANVPMLSHDLQHNISLIEKETQMVSKSYEDKVIALRREKALEECRLRAERDAQAEELAKYVQQCENDSKERQAIRTILEVKIMGLVDNITTLTHSPDCDSIRHDIVALRKLVTASVDALE
jgi:hypothetical protein